MAIRFFHVDKDFALKDKRSIVTWLKNVASAERYKLQSLNIIFCSDEFLLGMNMQYLQHDTYTDIITFGEADTDNLIEGELYISIERVSENAKSLDVNIITELHRVIIHGLLHLCGYNDKKTSDKREMSAKEDFYLSLRKFL